MGVDGGNDKDWEANACKIQLIKKKGKVKALDEEVHSNVLSLNFVPSPLPLLPSPFPTKLPFFPYFGVHLRIVMFRVEGREER